MNTTRQKIVTIIAGTASIVSLQMFGFFDLPEPRIFSSSKNLEILTSIWNDLPANAELNKTSTHRSSKQYIPPVASNPRRTIGSGSRGCRQSLTNDLVTLLIPSEEYAGQTISGHPTFFWHLSQPVSVPMRFALVEPGVAKPLFEKQIDSPQAGMIQLQVPKDRPELQTGRTYKWSVTLVCNTKRPSANPVFISWIERVSTPAALETQRLSTPAKSNVPTQVWRDRAWSYAETGLWYDALAAMSNVQTANSNELGINDDFLALLEQVGLTQVTQQERLDVAKRP
ncbi:DUF928 domain-containing protein [Coleofasciculus chthonoplastes]|jgi:hypothetical protein|uniref:DUF928 domain-containing protein n=1 Tax=Coleofasciculus chthonoplastes TaxID=64178 RepID=UPI0032FE0FDB